MVVTHFPKSIILVLSLIAVEVVLSSPPISGCLWNSCVNTKLTTLLPDLEDRKNILWWPNDARLWTKNFLNCPFAPPIEDFLDESLVKFYLFRTDSEDDSAEIIVDDIESLKNSGFIKNAPLKIITHGFRSSLNGGPLPPLRGYYFKLNSSINVIGVDWRNISGAAQLLIPCYNLAATLTRYVGERGAKLLKFLLEQNVVMLKDIHVLGHSLGAHASGFMGKKFFELTKLKVPRLTGFDPAGPSFLNKPPSERIDKSDADFVDIIHTATSDFDFIPHFGRSIELGLYQPVGHADFYPNKGGKQPGCGVRPFPVSNPACSHARSYEYYAESIQPPPPDEKVFRGVLCKNGYDDAKNGNCDGMETTLMGACTDIKNSTSKIYYLTTNGVSPFALDERMDSDHTFCPIL